MNLHLVSEPVQDREMFGRIRSKYAGGGVDTGDHKLSVCIFHQSICGGEQRRKEVVQSGDLTGAR